MRKITGSYHVAEAQVCGVRVACAAAGLAGSGVDGAVGVAGCALGLCVAV